MTPTPLDLANQPHGIRFQCIRYMHWCHLFLRQSTDFEVGNCLLTVIVVPEAIRPEQTLDNARVVVVSSLQRYRPSASDDEKRDEYLLGALAAVLLPA